MRLLGDLNCLNDQNCKCDVACWYFVLLSIYIYLYFASPLTLPLSLSFFLSFSFFFSIFTFPTCPYSQPSTLFFSLSLHTPATSTSSSSTPSSTTTFTATSGYSTTRHTKRSIEDDGYLNSNSGSRHRDKNSVLSFFLNRFKDTQPGTLILVRHGTYVRWHNFSVFWCNRTIK